MTITPGTRLGAYEILGPLGAGGMGEVYRARDLRLGRDVAIKVLPSEVASSSDRLARIGREARTVASLNHPSVVTLYSVEDDNGLQDGGLAEMKTSPQLRSLHDDPRWGAFLRKLGFV